MIYIYIYIYGLHPYGKADNGSSSLGLAEILVNHKGLQGLGPILKRFV
jgi:hypothetical protein